MVFNLSDGLMFMVTPKLVPFVVPDVWKKLSGYSRAEVESSAQSEFLSSYVLMAQLSFKLYDGFPLASLIVKATVEAAGS